MIDSGVLEPAKMSKVPKGVKLIDTTWSMKKKSNGALCKGVNVRGFKQIDGQHYDGTSISAPVTNAMTIRIALTIMLMQGGIAHVVDVKGAFLYGEFKNGEKIYIKILLGFEQFYPSNTVLLLKKTLYEFKQAAMAFYRNFFCGNKEYWADKKHGQSMPLLQVGKGKFGDNDIVDRRQHDSWSRRFGHASQG